MRECKAQQIFRGTGLQKLASPVTTFQWKTILRYKEMSLKQMFESSDQGDNMPPNGIYI